MMKQAASRRSTLIEQNVLSPGSGLQVKQAFSASKLPMPLLLVYAGCSNSGLRNL
jgi:hypothetical protein